MMLNKLIHCLDNSSTRSSIGQKKAPITISKDFFMVVESPKTENQLLINSPTFPKTNTTKTVQKKKQTTYSKTFHSWLNSVSAPIVTKKPFSVFHQNIRGLRNKINELLDSVLPQLPHVLCLTEHHAKDQEIETLYIDQYTLGAKYCRQGLKHGGTGIFVHDSLEFTNIDLQKFCIEQDIETCAVKVNIQSTVIYIYNMYLQSTNWQPWTFHERFRIHRKSIQ